MRPLIFYHGSCADGAGAAFAAWRKYGDDAEYRPVQYGSPPPSADEIVDRHVYILDFCWPRPDIERMWAAKGQGRFIVLDHHKSAMEQCGDLPYCIFDMKRSGAVMAWEFFHCSGLATDYNNVSFEAAQRIPLLLRYICDRDLWKWQLVESREIFAYLESMGVRKDFRALIPIAGGFDRAENRVSMVNEGRAILRFQDQIVESLASHAQEAVMDGHRILIANAPLFASEVGEKLAENRPLSAVWFINDKGQRVFSLRSRPPGGVDVSSIAKQRPGGGGHFGAAGFTDRSDRVASFLYRLIRDDVPVGKIEAHLAEIDKGGAREVVYSSKELEALARDIAIRLAGHT